MQHREHGGLIEPIVGGRAEPLEGLQLLQHLLSHLLPLALFQYFLLLPFL